MLAPCVPGWVHGWQKRNVCPGCRDFGFFVPFEFCQRGFLQEPQHAAPDRRHDLEVLIEGAKYDDVLRQPLIGGSVGNWLIVFRDQVAVRHVCWGFAVMAQVIQWRYRPFRKNIIDKACNVRSQETDIGDLDWYQSQGCDLQPAAANLATKVDQDIDCIPMNLLGCGLTRNIAQVDEQRIRCRKVLP